MHLASIMCEPTHIERHGNVVGTLDDHDPPGKVFTEADANSIIESYMESNSYAELVKEVLDRA